MSTLPEITEVKEDDHDDDDENKKSPVENESPKQDSTNINPQNQDQNSQKESSCLPNFFTSQPKKSTLKAPAENQASTTATTSTYSSIGEMSRSISADIKYITDEYQKLDKYKDSLQSQLAELSERLELLKKEGNDKEFQNLQKEVTKLKFQIPSKHKGDVEEKDPHKRQLTKNKPKTIPEKIWTQLLCGLRGEEKCNASEKQERFTLPMMALGDNVPEHEHVEGQTESEANLFAARRRGQAKEVIDLEGSSDVDPTAERAKKARSNGDVGTSVVAGCANPEPAGSTINLTSKVRAETYSRRPDKRPVM